MAGKVHQLPTAAPQPVVNPKHPGRWRQNVRSLNKARINREREQGDDMTQQAAAVREFLGDMFVLNCAKKLTGMACVIRLDGRLQVVLCGDLNGKTDEAVGELLRLSASESLKDK